MSRLRRHSAISWCVRAMSWCIPLALATPANADICKYVDREGNLHYTNVAPERGWKKLSCGVGGSGSSAERTARSAPGPAGFSEGDAGKQRGRDDFRRPGPTQGAENGEKIF